MSHLSVSLLGTFEVRLAEHPITAFEYDKVRALLAYLMVESDRPHRRESLAGLLWPEHTERAARQSLSQAQLVLRRTIADRDAVPPFLRITAQTLQFNVTSDFLLDMSRFISLVDGVQQHQHTDLVSCKSCLPQLEQGVSLYRGDFLIGFSLPDCPEFEIWLTLQRERIQQKALGALDQLTQAYLQCGEFERALGYAQRQLESDAWRESAYRQVMTALALSGQRSAALAQYETCAKILRAELDVEPEPATIMLYERIRAAEVAGEADIRLALNVEALAPAPGTPPFKGLDFFDVGDAGLFFGRDTLTAALVERLLQECRFLAVVGASGSGKSSLVRAGLAATLQLQKWKVQIFTPRASPLQNLQIAKSANQWEPSTKHPAPSTQHPVTSNQYLFVVDQFEELFTLCRDFGERQAFLDQLLAMAEDEDNATYVVIALRADFYHHCAQFGALRAMLEQNQIYVGPMTADELRKAIEAPAHQNGWAFEPGLVDVILRDLGAHTSHPPEPGALPLLSHALLETWQRRQGRTLTLGGYTGAGGVHRAIAHTAEAIYQGLEPEIQTIARHIFVRLTELGEGTQDTRRRVALQELVSLHARSSVVETLLKKLTDARLITSDAQAVQVTHEALVREWPALRVWLEDDREGLRLHRHLTEAARAWEGLGRDPGELYRGARLAQTMEWVAMHSNALNRLEVDFLDVSQAEVERMTREREAQSRRELGSAQALAAAERRRATERGRMLRWIGLVAVLMLVAAIAAGLLGNQARLTAQKNAALADDNAAIAATAIAANVLEAEQRAAAELAQQEEAEHRAAAELAQQQEAEQRAAAEASEHEALVQASVGLAARALDELDGISPERAVLLALAALEQYPYTPQAESALARAIYENWPYTVLSDSGGSQQPSRAAWSPDGRYIAVSEQYQENAVVIWDAEMAKIVQRLSWDVERTLQCATFDVAWSPSGDQVVVSSYHDGDRLAKCRTIQVWDVSSGALLRTLSGEEHWPWGVDWSPDGRAILAAYNDGTVRIWDADNDAESATISVTTSWVGDAVWAPTGDRFATASEDGIARIWNAETGGLILALSGHIGALNSVAWSPDAAQLATAGQDGNVRLWDVSTTFNTGTAPGKTALILSGHSGGGSSGGNLIFGGRGVLAVAWSPDGARIATAGSDRTIRVWNAGTGAELFKYYGVTDAWHVAWAPDSKHLAIRGYNETRILDLSAEPLRLYGHEGDAYDAQWSPDGTRIATGGMWTPGQQVENPPRIWDAASGTELLELHTSTSAPYLAWSPDGKQLATRGDIAQIWDAYTGELIKGIPYPNTEGWFHMVTWSPDGKQIATSNVFEFTVSLFDVATGEHLLTFGEPDCFKHAEWSPDGTRIATGCYIAENEAAPLRIWDAETGEELLAMDSPGGDTVLVEWSPDGARLASGHTGGMAMVWDPSTGEPLLAFAGHNEGVWDVTWSPNGKRIASGDTSGIVKVWDATTGAEVLSFQAPNQVVRLDWSPDGNYLAVAGAFNAPMVQRVWQSTEDLITYAHECCVSRELTPEERSQFMLAEIQRED